MSDDPTSRSGAPEAKLGRRSLLDLALTATAGGVGAMAMIPALRFASPPPRPPLGATGVVAGRRDEFPERSAKVVTLDGEPVLVVAVPGGDLRAFSARCTHLGCIVAYSAEREQIECPCHGGRFAADGRVLAGPPPSPLRELPVVLRGNEVLVVRG